MWVPDRFLALRWLVLLCVLPLGCSWCGRGPRRNAEEFIDKDATSVISIPSLGTFADHMDALKTSARKAGNSTVEWLVAMADKKAIGFDLFTRDGQKSVGIDPDGSMAAAVLGRREGYVALPYTDLSMLTSTLKGLANDRLGAGVASQRTIGKTDVTVLSATAGGPALFAMASKDRFLLAGLGPKSPEEVAAAAERMPENSAARAGSFAPEKARVGDRDIYVFLPHAPGRFAQELPGGILFGLSASENDLSVRAYFQAKGPQATHLAHALVSAPTPVMHLPADQPAYLRGAVDWSAVAQGLDQMPSTSAAMKALRAAFHAGGIDLDADVLANLAPGFAVTASLASTADLSTALNLDPRAQNPFNNYGVIFVGAVKDAVKAKAMLAKLPQVLAGFGATVTSHDLTPGMPVYTAQYQLGKGLSWMLHGNDFIAAGGFAEKLDTVLEGLLKGTAPLQRSAFAPAAAETLFGENGVALTIDFHKLAENIHTVSSSAPGNLIVSGLIDNFLKSLDQLRPVVALTPAEDGMNLDVVVNVKP